MLFSSFAFLFVFLPVVLIGIRILQISGKGRLVLCWLLACSLVFYAQWNIAYLPLFCGSICVNYGLSQRIAQSRFAKAWLATGIACNVLLLTYYKYAGFFEETVSSLTGTNHPVSSVIIPLGISFFTFQQIAYLVDVHRKIVEVPRFDCYALFVGMFAKITAGPIVRAKEMIPQLQATLAKRIESPYIAAGIALLAMGLFKKAILADSLATIVNIVFTRAAHGAPLSFYEGWSGALGYTLQIYFDFSGYSDMALGVAHLCGLRLPQNFNSPYKATGMIDFWRRWHITLSSWLRDYLYFPLGGNRKGPARKCLNLMITMLLGGMWHGAAWTFVFWGALHGLYLCINHVWRRIAVKPYLMWKPFAHLLTFFALVASWVFFRAESFHAAFGVLEGMIQIQSVHPAALWEGFMHWISSGLAMGTMPHWFVRIGWMAALCCILFFLPNSNEIVDRYILRQENTERETPSIALARTLGIGLGVMTFTALLGIALFHEQEFIYFQF